MGTRYSTLPIEINFYYSDIIITLFVKGNLIDSIALNKNRIKIEINSSTNNKEVFKVLYDIAINKITELDDIEFKKAFPEYTQEEDRDSKLEFLFDNKEEDSKNIDNKPVNMKKDFSFKGLFKF